MELKQVLVYDNQHGFSRFLKKEFGKKNDFKVYKKFNLINDFDTTKIDYSFVFFIMYTENDLSDFITIDKKQLPIVVCSLKRIFNKIDTNSELRFIDISKPKKELIHDFQFFLYE
jgi:hypothetical protein